MDKILIEKKVAEAFQSIDNIKPATVSSFFYARVLARINMKKITFWEKLSAFFLRPSIAFAAITFIIAVDTFVLYSKYKPHIPVTTQFEATSSDEYGETVTAFYDLENVKP